MTTRRLLDLRMLELKDYRERSHSGLRPQSLSVFETVISMSFFCHIKGNLSSEDV